MRFPRRTAPGRAGLALSFILAAPLALAATAAGAADRAAPSPGEAPASLHIQVRGDDGEDVDLRLSSGWLGALIRGATIECDADSHSDGDGRRMMESLRAQGEGGVWKERGRDGDEVLARRTRGLLKIRSAERGGDQAEIEMPWELAECLMLGVVPGGDLGGRIARGEAKFSVHLEDDDGSTVRLAIE